MAGIKSGVSGFKTNLSLYENGFNNRFKNNNDTNRDLLLCGSLPDLLRIIPKGHVSEIRNRFLSAQKPNETSSSSFSPSLSPGKRRRAELHFEPPSQPPLLIYYSYSPLTSGRASSYHTEETRNHQAHHQSHSTLRTQEAGRASQTQTKQQQHSIKCDRVPKPLRSKSSFLSSPDLTSQDETTSTPLGSSITSSVSQSVEDRSVKLRYRTSIRIMVRPESLSSARSESLERGGSSRPEKRGPSKHHLLGGTPKSSTRTIVKEQFRLPRDCSEKMPSASNSPLLSRKTYHRPHPSHLADPPSEDTTLEEVSKEILRKISTHQQLSVASMVRRFETREDIKTRAGHPEEEPSPKVSSCSSSSMSSSVGRSPESGDEEEAEYCPPKEINQEQKTQQPLQEPPKAGPKPNKGREREASLNSAESPPSASSMVPSNSKKTNSIPSSSIAPETTTSGGGEALPNAKPSSELHQNKKKPPPLQKPPSSSSPSVSPSPREPKRNLSGLPSTSLALRAVNKRSESDGIVLAERPKPQKTVRRCESVEDAASSLESSSDPFPSFSQAPCPATIIKGPEDAIKKVGDDVELSCHYFGDPDPEVAWSKNGKPLTSKDQRLTILFINGTSTLSLKDLRGEDGGKYECTVTNESGSDTSSASLSVPTPPEPPAGRPFVSDIDFSSRCLTLAWYGSTFDGGSIVTGYAAEMSSWAISSDPEPPVTEDWKVLTTGINSTSYIFKELHPGREYIFRIRSENVVGMSDPSLPSEPVRCLPNGEEEEGEDEESSEEASEDEEEDLDSFEAPFTHRIVALDEGSVFKRKYGVYDELGRGRFGVVFKVRDKETNEVLAAKFVKCRRSEDRQKVRDEIEIMNSLDYAKLLQLAAAYENPKEIIMVMEYIGGGELFEKVVQDDFTLTERDCVLFMKQICAAVGYMHSKDIVHLDLKPENILCKSKRSHQIKIIDFGLTRKLKPPDEVRILFGTPEFVSPEVINYEPVSTTSDMWSVGVVCYVLLSGLSPFMGDSDPETFGNITGIRYDFEDEAFDNISTEAKDFISSLLVKNQKERLSAYECLQHAWLAPGAEKTAALQAINTEKLKSFLMRRKWQKAAHAIRALGRFTSLGFRGDGKGSSSSISGFSTQSADF